MELYGWKRMYSGMGVLTMLENKQRDLIYVERKNNHWIALIHHHTGGYSEIYSNKSKSKTIQGIEQYLKEHPNE
jgi:hypothetical protein